ncbi:MAG TPA: hypothetical protein VMJ14_11495 [Burkholderiales bacterium]|nr:hypothetical protein [Burkholderiales bacterium]
MWSIVISTIVFFAASFFLKRYLDQNDFPKGMTRNVGVFALAAAASYAAAAAIDWIANHV